MFQIPPPLTGASLEKAMTEIPETRPFLIEGLLYQRSVLMISSEPGAGKSVLVANVLAQASSGLPVWNQFLCTKPLRCYYIPFERGNVEMLERLQAIRSSVPLTHENIFLQEGFIGLDIGNTNHVQHIVENIARDCQNPDIIFLDPILASIQGGLSSEENASKFTRFCERLLGTFGCSLWLNHHTTKPTYSSKDGSLIEKEDPFFGSQLLKMHVTGAYWFKVTSKENNQSALINKKDSHSNMIDRIALAFDPDDYLLSVVGGEESALKVGIIDTFLRQCYKSCTKFTFNQLKSCVNMVSTSYLRKLMRQPKYIACIKKHKSNGRETLYEVTELI